MLRSSSPKKLPVRLPGLAWAAAPARAASLSRLGAQSYSFRNFDVDGAIRCLRNLGLTQMEFCAVHFPPDPGDTELPAIKNKLATAGVTVPCFGVERFSEDAAANRKKFEFAKALGVEMLTADPAPDALDSLDALCEKFQIKIAIHNHGPGARYDGVANTLKAVEARLPFIGACVDTGHVIRSGEVPHEVIRQLGSRVLALHLKDWKQGGEEQIVGQGDLDLPKTVEALVDIGFSGPIVFEYELDPEGPVPGMKQGLENWRKAVAGV